MTICPRVIIESPYFEDNRSPYINFLYNITITFMNNIFCFHLSFILTQYETLNNLFKALIATTTLLETTTKNFKISLNPECQSETKRLEKKLNKLKKSHFSQVCLRLKSLTLPRYPHQQTFRHMPIVFLPLSDTFTLLPPRDRRPISVR